LSARQVSVVIIGFKEERKEESKEEGFRAKKLGSLPPFLFAVVSGQHRCCGRLWASLLLLLKKGSGQHRCCVQLESLPELLASTVAAGSFGLLGFLFKNGSGQHRCCV